MLVEEDKQQQQSPDDAPSNKLVCGEDTTERALTKALKINIGNCIGTTIAKLIVELSKHAYEEKLLSTKDKKRERRWKFRCQTKRVVCRAIDCQRGHG